MRRRTKYITDRGCEGLSGIYIFSEHGIKTIEDCDGPSRSRWLDNAPRIVLISTIERLCSALREVETILNLSCN